jgi:hypothetical protein
MTSVEHLRPNTEPITAGSLFEVQTEDHTMIIEVHPEGPYTKGYILSFVGSKPPLTESTFYPAEIYVRGNEINIGEVFELNSVFPLVSLAAFRALGITPLVPSEEATASEQ